MGKKQKYKLREVRRAIIYGRYSPGSRQTDRSIEDQIQACREYAEEHGILVVGVYADRRKTGTNDNRSDFRRMIDDSATGAFDAVLVWKNDRFGRNLEDQVINEVRLKRNGVSLISITEPRLEGALGAMQHAMLLGMAEFYSAANAENVSRGMESKAKECKVLGVVPLGYIKGPDGRHAIDPLQGPFVSEAFVRYDNGEGMASLLYDLNGRGFRAKTGKPVSISMLCAMFRNERYTGTYIWGDIRIEDGMPALVDRARFERVRKRVGNGKHSGQRSADTEAFLLSGKCYCGECKGRMVGTSGTGKSGSKYYYYACADQRTSRKKTACKMQAVAKDVLEDLVIDKTISYVLRDDTIERIADMVIDFSETHDNHVLLDDLKKRRAETVKAINNLLGLVEGGHASDTVTARLAEREDDLADIEYAISEQQALGAKYDRERIIYYLCQQREGDRKDAKYRQRLINMFVRSVTVYHDHIIICYNFDGDGGTEVTLEDLADAESAAEMASQGHFGQKKLSSHESSRELNLVNHRGLEPRTL